jgi:2-dehydro-3-deoxygluconokinase
MEHNCDLVTFGETMIRLSPPGHRRLEQATAFDVNVGGSELNTAVAAARLGLSSRFVTRLTRNPLGRMIANKAREQGVDTSHIVWSNSDRIGVYFVEFGASPRPNSVLYDRGDSAIARISPDDVDWDEALHGASIFHTSGITPALSDSAAATTIKAVRAAQSFDVKVSVDLNYRARLWSKEKARDVMMDIMSATDILITTEEDIERVFGIAGDSYEAVAKKLAEMFDLEVVAITLRENPSVWRNTWSAIAYEAATKTIHRAPVFDIEVVDRVGAGDSFTGGFFYGYLTDGVQKGVHYGVGMSALKQTHPGDLNWATLDEVERVLGGHGLRIVR